ncbi:MAG: phosphatase PAP2 family protein [Clostridiales bacterium]|nr:phosphatase PAP2 family protein [Clostridiales bacterium]
MKTKPTKRLLIFSAVYYAVFVILMVIGTFKDLEVSLALFNPESSFAVIAESFGQIVYWAMWGPALTVILLCRHDLYEILDFAMTHSKSARPFEIKNEKRFKIFNTLFKIIYFAVFFALAVIGWNKVIKNVTKNVLLLLDIENLSDLTYYIISVFAAALAVVIFSRIKPETLRRLEIGAVIGVFSGILFKCVEELKPLTERVRFREMVAYSNGYLNDSGMSEGRYSPLTSEMAGGADFSAFTPWYKKGDNMGIYSRADSFPSGHTCYSCALFLSYVYCCLFPKLKKAAPYALILSFVYTALMGYARIIAGAHYLTDVASAAIIGYTIFLAVRGAYMLLASKNILPKI